MSDEQAPSLLILCRRGERFDATLLLAGRRFPGIPNPVELIAYDGEPQDCVRRTRSERGGIPIGIVAEDEAAALAALEAGADEAIAEAHFDEASAFGFFDRLRLRSRLRREQEQMRAFYVHSEKLAALGTLVAGVAHEVNNPLTSLLLSVEGLKLRVNPVHDALAQLEELVCSKPVVGADDLQEVLRIGRTGAPIGETRELLQEIEASAQTIARVVRDLKLFSRPDDDAAPELIDVPVLMDQVLRIVGRQIRTYGSIELDYEPELPVIVAPAARLAQVFTNILLNAAQAIAEVTRPSHRIRISARSDEEAIAICISDSGPGISPDVLGRIFDPFFTTKRPGIGTGLGLSISRSILRRLGGDLLVESVHGDGATFIAVVPRPSRRELYEAYRRSSSFSAPPSKPRLNKRVLIVDADEGVLRAFARTLDSHYDVLLARDAEEAIDLLASGSQADVVVADIAPPELSGLALYDWVLKERPELARHLIFVTAEEQQRPALVNETAVAVLQKPVSRSDLLAALGQVFPDSSPPPSSRRAP